MSAALARPLDGSPARSFARLVAPRRSLVSCAPAYLVRSTLGSGGPGFNRYPASPLCSVSWQLSGSMAVVEDGVVSQELVSHPGDAIFAGPMTQPWTSCNPGPVHFLVVLFYPDALHALSGIDVSSCVDTFLPAEQVLGPSCQALTRALMAAPDDDARVALLDDFLEPRWRAVRGHAQLERGMLGDWMRRLAVQAASNGIGRGARAAERRVKAWAGLPMRTLRRMGRAEQALLAARAEQASGKICWVGVADDAGYADQSHLTRETRAITGLSPTELAHALEHDDSYWLYRIWS
jgi:AraC-like DNA-binding protein